MVSAVNVVSGDPVPAANLHEGECSKGSERKIFRESEKERERERKRNRKRKNKRVSERERQNVHPTLSPFIWSYGLNMLHHICL